jgi:uncharacterized protein (TIGR03083 family)
MVLGRGGINDMNAPDAALTPLQPVFLAELFPALHGQLMSLLRGLEAVDWDRPTACLLWSVKDIAAHLLDGSLRRLSLGRDGPKTAPGPAPSSYSDLVAYLNRLNAEWIAAAKRLSPRVLIDLLDHTGPQVHAFFRSLDPYAEALFAVVWAGQDRSPNWFDIGREYTERWLHQQQIREAVGAPGLNGREWLHPTLDIFVRALPFTYRVMAVEPGQSIEVGITGESGGVWTLLSEQGGWGLYLGTTGNPAARVLLDQETAWKLFSKGLSGQQARRAVRLEGDLRLGEPIFDALAVMA